MQCTVCLSWKSFADPLKGKTSVLRRSLETHKDLYLIFFSEPIWVNNFLRYRSTKKGFPLYVSRTGPRRLGPKRKVRPKGRLSRPVVEVPVVETCLSESESRRRSVPSSSFTKSGTKSLTDRWSLSIPCHYRWISVLCVTQSGILDLSLTQICNLDGDRSLYCHWSKEWQRLEVDFSLVNTSDLFKGSIWRLVRHGPRATHKSFVRNNSDKINNSPSFNRLRWGNSLGSFGSRLPNLCLDTLSVEVGYLRTWKSGENSNVYVKVSESLKRN